MESRHRRQRHLSMAHPRNTTRSRQTQNINARRTRLGQARTWLEECVRNERTKRLCPLKLNMKYDYFLHNLNAKKLHRQLLEDAVVSVFKKKTTKNLIRNKNINFFFRFI